MTCMPCLGDSPLPVPAPRLGSRAVQLAAQYPFDGLPAILVIDPHSEQKLGVSLGLVDVDTMISFLNRHAG